MGFGALIGAGISAAASIGGSLLSGGGSSGAGQVNAMLAKAQQAVQSAANQYINPFATGTGGAGYDYWNMMAGMPVNSIPDLARYSIDFGQQYGAQLNQYNMGQLQSLLGQALPGYQGTVNQMQANVNQMLQGVVPSDVQNQIQRSAAYTALQGGIGGGGAGTSMTGKAITARDLGLTSLQLQQTGFTEGSNLLQLARNYLMPQPVNPLSILPTSDLIQGAEWTKTANYNANLAAFNAAEQAASLGIGVPSGGGQQAANIGGAISGLAQSQPVQNLLSNLFQGGGGGDGGLFDLSEFGVNASL